MEKRRGCPNLKINRAKCPCPEDCPRRGMCCECIEFHAAMGEVPYCVSQQVKDGAKCSAGSVGEVPDAEKKVRGKLTIDHPDFRLIDYAKCAG